MIDRTSDEFIKALFDKRDITDPVEASETGYRLAKAFMGIKPETVPSMSIDGLNAHESFTLGYRTALDD